MKAIKYILLYFLLFTFSVLQSKNIAEVKGTLVDIIKVKTNATVFPQNRTFRFKSPLPALLNNKMVATTLIDNEGVSQAKFSETGDIYIGFPHESLLDESWINTGESFAISSARKYFIFKHKYETVGEWIDIPQKKASKNAPTLLFADEIYWANPRQVPGTVIAKVALLKNTHLTNPTIVVLPDGDYLAAISGAFQKPKQKRGTSFFISSDKGQTWRLQSKNSLEINYANLFVHKGELYIMGTRAPRREVIISKSVNKGKTWTQAEDKNNGIILEGKYHSAPVPVVEHNGRIWRAMETNLDRKIKKKAFVMSASVNSDLLKASSWTTSDELEYNESWIDDNGRSFKQWIEGNVVVDRKGNIVNVLRVDEQKEGGVAAIITLSGTRKVAFDPQKDIINFPGGEKKFTIRYDSLSNKYWTLSNPVFDEDRKLRHDGIYKDGLHCGLIRNHLVLMYSDDLRNWIVKDTLITSNDPFFHGFQYVDWQFDGNDIVAVSRTAFDEVRGLPTRQHDANFFTFHKFKNFRTDVVETIIIE